MAERNPNSNKAEREADYSTYSGIAADFFDRYVGDAVPPGTEDVDAWREQTRSEVADHMAGIARDMPQEERVKAYAEIIEGLKELRGSTGAAPMETNAEAAEPNEGESSEAKTTLAEKARLAKANAEIAIRTNAKYLSLPGIFAAAQYKVHQFAEKVTPRKEDESDAAYERRVRRRKVGAGIAAVALAAGGAWILKDAVGSAPGENNEFADVVPESESEAGFGESDYPREDRVLDIENTPQTYEQSIQTELDFLAENGRINNDFNHIDPFSGQENIMDELHEQYTKSPSELSGQLYQVQGIEGTVDAIPEHLRVLDGESYEAYSARLSEALHHDPALHDSLVEYTVDYVDGKYNLQDMPAHYRAAYIDENGVTRWDTSVSSGDPNDRIIMLAEGKGIRLPCGQPVEVIPTAAVPQGVGGAPAAYTVPGAEYTPSTPHTPITPDTPGVGGPPPSTPGEPPVTHETPPPVEPPVEEEPPVPSEEKDWSRVPDQEGVTPLPLDQSKTPLTGEPTVGDNGTSSPDFVPGVEGSTPGSDSGPGVAVPEAQTPTIDVSGNKTEAGANATDTTGNSIPDGTFDDSNL